MPHDTPAPGPGAARLSRRRFLTAAPSAVAATAATAAGLTLMSGHGRRASAEKAAAAMPSPADVPVDPPERDEWITAALEQPVLDTGRFTDPLVLESVEILNNGPIWLVRVRSRDGAEGLAVANDLHFAVLHPLMADRIVPPLIGQDLRRWETDLLHRVYVHRSNYKLQGLAFWSGLAALELAVLDLMGRLAGVPVGQLLGGVVRDHVEVYQAFGDRDTTPEQSVENMKRVLAQTGARAVKFKVGGRMSFNRDSLPGRSEALIPLVRQELGPDMTLYADSNGSYDVDNSIRIGRLMEEHGYGFFEEPCPFDHFGDTKRVADALDVPVAGGEQDSSFYNLRWALKHDALQVVQPDVFYFGGMVRSVQVARMAQALGRDCSTHISGTGLGFLYMMHFCSCLPNPGPYQSFKGTNPRIPVRSDTSSLQAEHGRLTIPTGPGFGIEIDPDFVAAARRV